MSDPVPVQALAETQVWGDTARKGWDMWELCALRNCLDAIYGENEFYVYFYLI